MRHLLVVLFSIPYLLFAQAIEGTMLGHWSDSTLVGSFTYDNTYNEIWGIARNGHEYAILGSTAGTHVIDVTAPTRPQQAFFIPGQVSNGEIIHRDYHEYGDYLYAVADEGFSTLQILDLSQLPEQLPVVYDSDEYFRQAHNIFIDSTRAMLYCFATKGGPQQYSALRLYSLANPLRPQYVGQYNRFGNMSVGHVHDGFVRDGIAFLNCGNDGFALVDFTNPQQPVTLTTLSNYTQSGYNHSGWPSESCGYYYMSDENHNKDIKVVDLTNDCEAEVVHTFDEGLSMTGTIAHNQVVACNYLYVSYYYNGLRVYDISDPTRPELAMYYDTSSKPLRDSYEGAWGVYPFLPSGNILVSDMQEGLFVMAAMPGACNSTAATPQTNCEDYCNLTSTTVDVLPTPSPMQVFPQPASNTITLTFPALPAQMTFSLDILDMRGKVVAQLGSHTFSTTQAQTFSLPNLTKGLYLLRSSNAEYQQIQKLIIN
ncbi:MAG: choice-of-anchor B family protein [Bacteroidota bacterium]